MTNIQDSKKFNQGVGNELKRLREIAGLNQTQLAKRMKCCRNTIVNLEMGNRKSFVPITWINNFLVALELPVTLEEFFKTCSF